MNAIIEFLPDPKTGKKQVLDLIRQIGRVGKNDKDVLQLYMLIIRGLDFLRKYGLPDAFKRFFQTKREDGQPYTILLVKKLRNHAPLLEFRVNWRGAGAFRAVFFEYTLDGQQILCFVRAVIKQRTYDKRFERIVREAETIYRDFADHPEKYIF